MPDMNIPTVLVGTGFKGTVAIEAVAQMMAGSIVRLAREPENPKDPQAVACHYLGQHVGYIPQRVNPRVAEALDRGVLVQCAVREPAVIKRNRVVVEPKLTITWRQP
jgi:hypothetical protein